MIVPSIGRPGLIPLIDSLPGDWIEWVVVFDGMRRDRQQEMNAARRKLEDRGIETHWLAVGHDWGHPQRNYGMEVARGEWLTFSQDDQSFEPSAGYVLREAIDGRWGRYGPKLFRLRKWWPRSSALVWMERGRLEMNMVDCDCLLVPNDPTRLGTFGTGYAADWPFVRDTVAAWGDVEWRDDIVQCGVGDAVFRQ